MTASLERRETKAIQFLEARLEKNEQDNTADLPSEIFRTGGSAGFPLSAKEWKQQSKQDCTSEQRLQFSRDQRIAFRERLLGLAFRFRGIPDTQGHMTQGWRTPHPCFAQKVDGLID